MPYYAPVDGEIHPCELLGLLARAGPRCRLCLLFRLPATLLVAEFWFQDTWLRLSMRYRLSAPLLGTHEDEQLHASEAFLNDFACPCWGESKLSSLRLNAFQFPGPSRSAGLPTLLRFLRFSFSILLRGSRSVGPQSAELFRSSGLLLDPLAPGLVASPKFPYPPSIPLCMRKRNFRSTFSQTRWKTFIYSWKGAGRSPGFLLICHGVCYFVRFWSDITYGNHRAGCTGAFFHFS